MRGNSGSTYDGLCDRLARLEALQRGDHSDAFIQSMLHAFGATIEENKARLSEEQLAAVKERYDRISTTHFQKLRAAQKALGVVPPAEPQTAIVATALRLVNQYEAENTLDVVLPDAIESLQHSTVLASSCQAEDILATIARYEILELFWHYSEEAEREVRGRISQYSAVLGREIELRCEIVSRLHRYERASGRERSRHAQAVMLLYDEAKRLAGAGDAPTLARYGMPFLEMIVARVDKSDLNG